MKKIYLAAATLLVITAVGCNAPQTNSTTNPASTEKVDAGDYSGIVYIDSDSLISGYLMYKDLSTEFQLKAEKVQKELNTKAANFETQIKSFQNKVEKGLITRGEAQRQQGELEAEQQTILQYRDGKMKELQEEEMVMTNNISENVKQYIQRYNSNKKYKMIINTSVSTNVVVAADPSLNITAEVLVGLNSEYKPVVKK